MMKLNRAAGWYCCTLLVVAAVGGAAWPPAARAQESSDSAPRMTMDEFKKRMTTGDVVVVDVRGPETYRMGHIPGAILVPLATVSAKAPEFKGSKKPIVTYCS